MFTIGSAFARRDVGAQFATQDQSAERCLPVVFLVAQLLSKALAIHLAIVVGRLGKLGAFSYQAGALLCSRIEKKAPTPSHVPSLASAYVGHSFSTSSAL
jgi:hypothetical protein